MVPFGGKGMMPAGCMRCGYSGQMIQQSKVAPAGWVVFAVLVFFFLPLCWVGLFIKQKVAQCPQCRNTTPIM
jgi:hypothetical protein